MTSIHIGFDSSLIEDGASAESSRVYVEAFDCDVYITCAMGDAWAGYKVVREFDTQEQAESLAWAIARNPVAEFDRIGYQHSGWFVLAD